ncbi:asparagine synthetase B, partial [Vibrio anguillarum]
GWTKYLARLAFDKKLPDEITWRKDKMGWPIPEEHWFRGNLRLWASDTLMNSKVLKEISPELDAETEFKSNIKKSIRKLNIATINKLNFW